MNVESPRWVLGHLVKPLASPPEFALMEIVSRPGVPGPPPHHHEGVTEFFYVVKGRLELMTDGAWRTLEAGDSAVAPPGTVHTFINKGDVDAVWLTTFSPRGFERFFADFGVAGTDDEAFATSVSEPMLARVGAECRDYGMLVAEGPGD